MTFLTIGKKDEETWKDQQEDIDIGRDLVIQWLSDTVYYSWQIKNPLNVIVNLRVSAWQSESDLDSIRNSCDVYDMAWSAW